jgi:hypothetical protein
LNISDISKNTPYTNAVISNLINGDSITYYVNSQFSNKQSPYIVDNVIITSSVNISGSYLPYSLYAFTGNGTIRSNLDISVNYVVVGGGGGGGYGCSIGSKNCGGDGGGGGCVITGSFMMIANTTYTITIGNGGFGGNATFFDGKKGGNSTISGSGLTTVTAVGGNGGTAPGSGSVTVAGGVGASGGGSGGIGANNSTTIQNSPAICGSVGTTGSIIGLSNTFTWYYGGGGGGGTSGSDVHTFPTSPGIAYGGADYRKGGNGNSGTNNTGGGGGGAGPTSGSRYNGGSGGSGIVLIYLL